MIEIKGPSIHGVYSFSIKNTETGETRELGNVRNRINPKLYEQMLFSNYQRRISTHYCFIGLDTVDENNDDEWREYIPPTWDTGHTFESIRWRESNGNGNGFLLSTNHVVGVKRELIFRKSWTFPKGYAGTIKSVAVGHIAASGHDIYKPIIAGHVMPYMAESVHNAYKVQYAFNFLSKANIKENNALSSFTMSDIDELTVTYDVIYDFDSYAPDKRITIDVDGRKIGATIKRLSKPTPTETNMTFESGQRLWLKPEPFVLNHFQSGNVFKDGKISSKGWYGTLLYRRNRDTGDVVSIWNNYGGDLTFVDRPDPVNKPFVYRVKIDMGINDGNGTWDALQFKHFMELYQVDLDEEITKTNEMEMTIIFTLDMGGVNRAT